MYETIVWTKKEVKNGITWLKYLGYEEWEEVNRDELSIIFAENGADRELCFDWERDAEAIYDAGSTP